jgi:hypothetical protein
MSEEQFKRLNRKTQEELILNQCGNLEPEDLEGVENLSEGLIDDSLAGLIRLIMTGNEEKILDVIALTRQKLNKN